MARGEDRKAELIAELALARKGISVTAANVRAELDVGAKVKRSVKRNMWWWLGGAVFVGVILAKLPARTKKVHVDEKGRKVRGSNVAATGAVFAGAKIAFDLARPFLLKWASQRVADYVRQKTGQDYEDVDVDV